MEPVFIAILTTLCVCLAAAYWMLSGLVDKLDNENANLRQRIDLLERRNSVRSTIDELEPSEWERECG